MKVFVSHHHDDAKKLARVRPYLLEHNIKLFLAHEDIDIGENDHKRMMKEIFDCDVFLLVGNEKSKKSLFCNQEIGMAFTLKKHIIPAVNGLLPWGFIEGVQAMKYTDINDDFCSRLLEQLEPLKKTAPKISLSNNQPISDLATMNLLGSWEESSEGDKSIAEQLADQGLSNWMAKIRESLKDSESPLTLKNGIWTVKNRLEMWKLLGESVFDEHLDKFQECTIQVLSEPDPKFELPSDKRFMANIYNKIPQHSEYLRKGIAETLALLSNHSEVLKNCSRDKAEQTAVLSIRRIFKGSDWILWASLDNVLPLLAEAAPNEFIDAVEGALNQTPCPFDNLFSQETVGVFGRTYICGLLRALENLAWNKEYLSRVTILLGELASRDPGGNWVNRPGNSLSTIFLPWLPQTMASWEKQKVAIKTLQTENPEIAWKTLLKLLPSSHGSSSGSHKPWSYLVPDHPKVTGKEYRSQVSFYSGIATEMAMREGDKLIELVEYFDHLPSDSFNKLIKHIESHEMPQEKKLILWEKLVDFASRHRKFSYTNWALPKHLVKQIEKVANKIAPDDLQNQHSRLFNEEDHDLYEGKGSYEQQTKEIQSRRKNAIKEIFNNGGIDSVIQFSQNVKHSFEVGFSLGSFINNKEDHSILKSHLQTTSKNVANFVDGFIQGKYQQQGWNWIDEIDTAEWTELQKGQFLRSLPFNNETWKRTEHWLKNTEEYWRSVIVRPHHLEKKEFHIAINELLNKSRPISTIDCLYHMLHNKLPLPSKQSIEALLKATSTQEGNPSIGTDYSVVEIIKNLQNDPDVNLDDLSKVEWAYLRLLDKRSGVSPRTLEQRLASDPKFFHEIISLACKSRSETEKQKNIAQNASHLLMTWKIPPGTQPNGVFCEDKFRTWLETALKLCKESNSLEVAESIIGTVLIHSPKNPNGLWIHRTVAETLNNKDAEKIRAGFSRGFFNARGVCNIDPTGKPERELAEKYRGMAEEIENKGFQRLGATLKKLAETYDREARSRTTHRNDEKHNGMKINDR